MEKIDLRAAAVELLKHNTVTSRGNASIMPVLRQYLQNAGMPVSIQRVERDGVEQNNLVAMRGQGPGGLLLITHIDTTEPGNEQAWTATGGDPFNPSIDGDRIFGLGAADSKLDWLAKAVALNRLAKRQLSRPVMLVASWGEQMGFLGARHLMASGEVRSQFAAVGSPSECQVVYAHKGYLIVRVNLALKTPQAPRAGMSITRLVCRGRDAHSSDPEMGDNAIFKGLHVFEAFRAKGKALHVVSIEGGNVINRVPDFCYLDAADAQSVLDGFDENGVTAVAVTRVTDGEDLSATLHVMQKIWKSWREAADLLDPQRDDSFRPPKVVYNCSTCRGASGKLSFTLDCRLLPEHDPEDMVTALDGILRDLEYKYPDVAASFEIVHLSRGMQGSMDSSLVKTCLAVLSSVGLPQRAITMSATTEGAIVSSYGPETVVFGPGQFSGVAGSPNEYNLLSQVEKAADFYESLIVRLCG